MDCRTTDRRWALFVLFALWLAGPAKAVIFFDTADPTYNTSAPAGALVNSGWQWEGDWGGFLGTPVSAHHFLAANHVGGAVGDPFIFSGMTYTTVAVVHDPSSDLVLWEVSGSFPSWAPLYRNTDEVGRALAVFGRGLSRGAEIRVNNLLKGWMWGTGGGVLRWGENRVAAISNGGTGLGDLLYATFDSGQGNNEAQLAVGDSSGAIFIEDGETWKLAGLAYGVDAYFNTTNAGSGFEAAIFDANGLYYGSSGNWTLITEPIPSGFYATRISSHLAWIDSVLANDAVDPNVPLLQPPHFIILAASLIIFGVVALSPKLVAKRARIFL